MTASAAGGQELMPVPSMEHEAPVELLRNDPRLVGMLLAQLGQPLPPDYTAETVDSDVSAAAPAQFLTDNVILLRDKTALTPEERARRKKNKARNAGEGELAVIVEIQLRFEEEKFWTWPAYLGQVRARYLCDTKLIVISPDPVEAEKCRQPIPTGHAGNVLVPLVIDRTAPLPRPSGPGTVTPEEAVLAVMIGAVDLGTEEARHAVLAAMAPLAGELRSTYAVFIRRAAPPEALARVEELMSTTYRDTFVEGLLAEGQAKGQAQTLLRVLKARHLPVTAARRRQVEECTDTAQLETWADLAANATSIDQVFRD